MAARKKKNPLRVQSPKPPKPPKPPKETTGEPKKRRSYEERIADYHKKIADLEARKAIAAAKGNPKVKTVQKTLKIMDETELQEDPRYDDARALLEDLCDHLSKGTEPANAAAE